MKKIVVFTGAGVSAESGLGTFRDSDGLWEQYRVEDVCTHEAWLRNPQLCVKFYNDRRRVHLHGEITKLRSSINETATVPLEGWEQHYGDKHPDGSLLRPYIVFFGEGVPYFDEACRIASTADIMIVVGTSLNVYPAASLLHYTKPGIPVYFVDPGQPEFGVWADHITHIKKKATEGVPELVEKLINNEDI